MFDPSQRKDVRDKLEAVREELVAIKGAGLASAQEVRAFREGFDAASRLAVSFCDAAADVAAMKRGRT